MICKLNKIQVQVLSLVHQFFIQENILKHLWLQNVLSPAVDPLLWTEVISHGTFYLTQLEGESRAVPLRDCVVTHTRKRSWLDPGVAHAE